MLMLSMIPCVLPNIYFFYFFSNQCILNIELLHVLSHREKNLSRVVEPKKLHVLNAYYSSKSNPQATWLNRCNRMIVLTIFKEWIVGVAQDRLSTDKRGTIILIQGYVKLKPL
jgi:hypothetical protein